jgi:broad specificity phosphatase PhoE
MPTLLLIRHATNDFVKTGRLPGQTPNIHLNEEGRGQAEALGNMLKHRTIDAVYASQLERAIETAWRIASLHGHTIEIRPGVADINNGTFTGRVIKELSEDETTKAIWKIVVEKPSEASFPEGESMLGMQQRIVDTLMAIARAHPDIDEPLPPDAQRPAEPAKDGAVAEAPKTVKRSQTVAIVMHADPIKAALAHFLGMPFDNFQRLAVTPASVSAVMIGLDENSKPMVLNVNQTA